MEASLGYSVRLCLKKYLKKKKIKGERGEKGRGKEGEGRGETTERFVD